MTKYYVVFDGTSAFVTDDKTEGEVMFSSFDIDQCDEQCDMINLEINA